ncbi:hypothetical protein [Candidatus Uabimicrobium amorphum]|uniref:Uncharacterized protein n=1 Tax=Uabimicrobium amorphum TaxID=2596890 RepID=A0A5S9F6N2_UABAM|nr:hypothetical protein [Candidatus Uabimicrobium amorphum]BBM86794.1 hypothetical protein UABAM_05182 [Candidatus Uabimicrobium amorphum]
MKYKVEHCIDTMHYQSTEFVQFVQQDVRQYRIQLEEKILDDLINLKDMVSQSQLYYEDPDFKISFDSIATTLDYIHEAIGKLVESRMIPMLRTEFSTKVNAYGKKIAENDLKEAVCSIVDSFAQQMIEKLDHFIQQIDHSKEQTKNRFENFEHELKIYNKLNKDILEGQFIEEVSLLHALSSMLQELAMALDIFKQGIENLKNTLEKYGEHVYTTFIKEVGKRHTSFMSFFGKNKKEENSESKGQTPVSKRAKRKISAIKNIDTMPMPDFTSKKGKNSAQIAVDFPYNNSKIIEVIMQFTVGKYTAQKVKLELETIFQKKAIFILSAAAGVDLEPFKKDVVHDVISTMQLVVKRRRVQVQVQEGLQVHYLSKIVPKIPFADGNLNFVSYEKNGNLVLEYVDLAEETEKLDESKLQKTLTECFAIFE